MHNVLHILKHLGKGFSLPKNAPELGANRLKQCKWTALARSSIKLVLVLLVCPRNLRWNPDENIHRNRNSRARSWFESPSA